MRPNASVKQKDIQSATQLRLRVPVVDVGRRIGGHQSWRLANRPRTDPVWGAVAIGEQKPHPPGQSACTIEQSPGDASGGHGWFQQRSADEALLRLRASLRQCEVAPQPMPTRKRARPLTPLVGSWAPLVRVLHPCGNRGARVPHPRPYEPRSTTSFSSAGWEQPTWIGLRFSSIWGESWGQHNPEPDVVVPVRGVVPVPVRGPAVVRVVVPTAAPVDPVRAAWRPTQHRTYPTARRLRKLRHPRRQTVRSTAGAAPAP